MTQPADVTPPAASPSPWRPSPARVGIFALMFAITVAFLILSARARESGDAKRLEANYYRAVGDFLTRLTLGLESAESQGATLPAGYSTDRVAEQAARQYQLALDRREDDLALRVAVATLYWHAGLTAEARMEQNRREGRLAEAQELSFRAGDLKTEAMRALQGGLHLHPRDPTISALVYGLAPMVPVKREWVENPEVRRIAAGIAPGRLLMSMLYDRAGMPRRARAELDRAYAVGEPTVAKASLALMLLVAGMLAGVAIWIVALLRARRKPPTREPAPWSAWRAAELFVLWWFLSLVLEYAAARLAPALGSARLATALSLAASYLAAGVVAIAWFARGAPSGGVGLRELGWRRIGVAAAAGAGIAGYLAVLPVVYPVLALINRFVGSPPTSPVVWIMMSASGGARAALIALVVVVAPLVEETIFRGALYGGLRRRMGFGWAASISAVVFSGAHAQPTAFVPIAILGVILAYVYERSGSLWASAITHAAFNGASVAALYLLMS